MRCNYADILALSKEPPLWFDECGVPRYVKFTPSAVANIYASEAVLAEIGCQHCGRAFQVAFSGKSRNPDRLSDRIVANTLEYGDPPDVGCCGTGPVVSSESRRVIEYWTRSDVHDVATEALHARLTSDHAALLRNLESAGELLEFVEGWARRLAAKLELAASTAPSSLLNFERMVWTRDTRLEVPIYPRYRIDLQGAPFE
ncbi:MAG: hypothetical protein ABL889_22250 [Terricaulis sp.]